MNDLRSRYEVYSMAGPYPRSNILKMGPLTETVLFELFRRRSSDGSFDPLENPDKCEADDVTEMTEQESKQFETTDEESETEESSAILATLTVKNLNNDFSSQIHIVQHAIPGAEMSDCSIFSTLEEYIPDSIQPDLTVLALSQLLSQDLLAGSSQSSSERGGTSQFWRLLMRTHEKKLIKQRLQEFLKGRKLTFQLQLQRVSPDFVIKKVVAVFEQRDA